MEVSEQITSVVKLPQPKHIETIGTIKYVMANCSSCGIQTIWEFDLDNKPLCSNCWDIKANAKTKTGLCKLHYRIKNKGKIATYMRQYYLQNRDKRIAYQIQYNKSHKEKLAEYRRRYRQNISNKLRGNNQK